MRRALLLAPLVCAGCEAEDGDLYWLQRFGFGWNGFNHRVSFLHFSVDEDGLDMGVVGGASSTAWVPALPDGCDPEACDEYPFEDASAVTIGWGRTSTGLAHGVAEITVVARPDGASQWLEIPLSGRGRGEVAALLQGITVDTDYPLTGGESCYAPSLGWHPRHIAVTLNDPALDGDGSVARVEVKAAFEAGYSFEEYRACQDEVVEELQVPVTVRVLAVATRDGLERQAVSHGMAYAFSGDPVYPGEQPDPDLAGRPFAPSFDRTIAGWSALDFRFHEDDPALRGAYLRTMCVGVDTEEGWASGHATNYSPLTQLSDFAYQFVGEVTEVETDGEIDQGVATFEDLDAELDDEHRPELHHEGWK